MSARVNFYLNLDKIDPEKIQKKKNGRYINLIMYINDETRYGNNCGIIMSNTPEERENGVKSVYIGNGAVRHISEEGITLAEIEEKPPQTSNVVEEDDDDGLPF